MLIALVNVCRPCKIPLLHVIIGIFKRMIAYIKVAFQFILTCKTSLYTKSRAFFQFCYYLLSRIPYLIRVRDTNIRVYHINNTVRSLIAQRIATSLYINTSLHKGHDYCYLCSVINLSGQEFSWNRVQNSNCTY